MSNDTPAASAPPDEPAIAHSEPLPVSDEWVPVEHKKFQDRVWLHVLLFCLTVYTTTSMGFAYYVSYLVEFGRHRVNLTQLSFWDGLWYSVPVLAILTAHELGHYVMCRRYRIDASLPFFLPMPLPPSGTLGAVIRVREQFPTRKALFDMGIAGPIAGFVVLIPFLWWGMLHSSVLRMPVAPQAGLAFGEPLLFKGFTYLVFGTIPEGYALNGHPMVFSSLFGMLATALNLLPFGQLDGGHIAYCAVGTNNARRISQATIAVAVVMTFVSVSWVVFTILLLAMMFTFGPTHPSVRYEDEQIGRSRTVLAVFAAIMLALCFTPVPIQVVR